MQEQPKLQAMLYAFRQLDLPSCYPDVHPQKLLTLLKQADVETDIVLMVTLIGIDNVLSQQQIGYLLRAFESNKLLLGINDNQKLVLYSELVDLGHKNKNLLLSISPCLINSISLCQNVSNLKEMKDKVFNFFASPDKDYLTFGFNILKATYSSHRYNKDYVIIANVFELLLDHEDIAIQKQVAWLLDTILKEEEVGFVNYFQHLNKKLMEVAFKQAEFYNTRDICQVLSSILDNRSKFFAPVLTEYVATWRNIALLPNFKEQRPLIEDLKMAVRKFSKYFQNNLNDFLVILELIFLEMVKISEEIDELWQYPLPGVQLSENDPNQQPITYGMAALDELFDTLPSRVIFNIFCYAVQEMNKKTDWRYQFAALMAVSQIAEFLKKKQQFTAIVQFIFLNHDSPNPKIRFACYHAMGQTVDDKRDLVHQLYFDLFLQKIIVGIQDPVTRVRAHAFACFTNFVEGMQKKKLQPYVLNLLQVILNEFKSNILVCQQNCLASMHEISSVLGKDLYKYNYQQILQIIYKMFQSPFKQLRCQAVQTYSRMIFDLSIEATPQQKLQLEGFVQLVKSMLVESLTPNDALGESYIISAIIRLEEACGKFLDLYEQSNALIFIEAVLMDNQDQQTIVNAFALLKIYITRGILRQNQFYDRILVMIENIAATEDSTGQKHQHAYNIYTWILQNILKTNPQNFQSFWCLYMNNLIEAAQIEPFNFQLEFDNDIIPHVLESILEILSLRTFPMNTLILARFANYLTQTVAMATENSLQVRAKINEDMDEEEVQIFQALTETQQSIIEKCLEAVEYLYKNYQSNNNVIKLLETMISTAMPKLTNSIYQPHIKLGLFILADAVQSGPFSSLNNIWNDCLKAFLNFLNNKNHSIRQTAGFGLGIWLQRNNKPITSNDLANIRQGLIWALNIPLDDESQKQYTYAQDNIAAAIGWYLKYQNGYLHKDVLYAWLDYLPIKKDAEQALKQHRLLLNLVNTIFTKDEQGLKVIVKILKALPQIYGKKKISNSEINSLIKNFLKGLYGNPFVVENSSFIWDNLPQEIRFNLTQIQMENFSLGQ